MRSIRFLAARSSGMTVALLTSLMLAFTGRPARAAGSAYAWGENYNGQLADGSAWSRVTPGVVAGFPGGVSAVAVTAGSRFAAALGSDGKVYAWGNNSNGQLGDGTAVSRHNPAPVEGIPNGVQIIRVAAGGTYCLALGSNGVVYAWGDNGHGQLGDGTLISRSGAAPVVGFPDGVSVTAVAAGEAHSLAIGSDGKVYGWGWNESSRIGNLAGSNISVPTPVPAYNLAYSPTYDAVEAGSQASAAVFPSGAISMWSYLAPSGYVPERIPAGDAIADISLGRTWALLLLRSGALWVFGRSAYGEMGVGQEEYRYSIPPVPIPGLSGITIAGCDVGRYFSVAWTSTGQLYAWGRNNSGQLGTPTAGNLSSPGLVSGFPVGVSVLSAAAGDDFALAVGSDGRVYGWGRNPYGGLGIPTPRDRTLPNLAAASFPPGTSVVSIAAGDSHNLAVAADGSIYAWGRNDRGQLGNGFHHSRFTPTPVESWPSGLGVSSASVGGSYSLALAANGILYAWGRNNDGQLGDGTKEARDAPAPVSGFPSGVTVTAMSAGQSHAAAVGSDGNAYAWGYNLDGQLGDGTRQSRTSPVHVSGFPDGVTVTAIAAGMNHTLAIGSDGRVYAWGGNLEGQLGDGTEVSRSTAGAVIGLPAGAPAVAIVASCNFSFALCSNGQLYAWGSNWAGQLGDGTKIERNAAVPINGFPVGVSVGAVAAGDWHGLAVGSDGKAYAWGSNSAGQLGDGTTTGRDAPAAVLGLPAGAGVEGVAAGSDDSLLIVNGVVQPIGLNDVRRALMIAGGLAEAQTGDLDRDDIMRSGGSEGRIDLVDAVALLRTVTGLNPAP